MQPTVTAQREQNLLPKASAATVEEKSLIRFFTCGSVDDGKSTLIGRLLYETQSLTDDQRDALVRNSEGSGNIGADGLDFSVLVDGLQAERQQGITIDVAYRYFETARHKYIVADTPGHEQYTRNMATGASTSEIAVVVIDARYGVREQTRRHTHIARLVGIKNFILAVNKMDAVDFDQKGFAAISQDFMSLAENLSIERVSIVPISARDGHNVVERSMRMPWYSGPGILGALERIELDRGRRAEELPFRFPVQHVVRPNQDFRGYAGTVVSGTIRVDDNVIVLPSGLRTKISRIVTMDGDLAAASSGYAVVLCLADEVELGRGDLISAVDDRPQIADQFAAHLIWFGEEPLFPGRSYYMRLGPRLVGFQVTSLRHKIDPNDLGHIAAKRLETNEIALCHIMLDEAVPFDPHDQIAEMGRFAIIDRATNATVGCGMVMYALRRALNLHWQHIDVDKASRAVLKGQKPCILWFTGLSGSGKSTIANFVEKKLVAMSCHTFLLDGDNIRHGLNKDLGFTDQDRVENIRRIGECAKLFVDAGLIVITAFISPFREERDMARRMVDGEEFFELYVSTSLELCESRDPKGLYKKARNGQLPNFTGIDSPYEQPENAEMILDTSAHKPEELADQIVAMLKTKGYIS